MRKYLLLLILAITIFAGNPEIYSLIRVDWGWMSQIKGDIVNSRPGVWAEYALSEGEMANLDFNRIPYDMIIPDMAEFYRSRLNSSLDMGGWRTYEMIIAAMESLHTAYPALVSVPETIGCGHNGNAIVMIKISDNVNIDEDEPEVLIGLGIHAREVIAPEIVIQYAQWLVQNYGIDERATHIVDTREVWFIPLMNPDGYRYNEVMNPGGGGMWRKNRRNNGGGSYGVDLNRNFPHMWGLDDVGSSPDPSDETYRGPSAGSEPESQAIIDFVNSRNFRTLLGFHSYSNLYLTPWGYTYDLCEDHDWFIRIAYRYARNNGYIYGAGAATIYPTNGDTDDWFYGATTAHPKILAITPEVGGSADGFWPSLSRKQPLVDENHEACVVSCQVAGSAPFLAKAWIDDATPSGDSSGFADPGETFNLMLEIENLGWDASVAYVLSYYEGSGVTISPDTAWCAEIPSQGYDTTLFSVYLDPTRFESGDLVTIHFEIRDVNGHLTFDSTRFIVGTPEIVILYDFESGNGGFSRTNDWEWGIPTSGPEQAHSGEKLWATKLAGSYTNNTRSVLSMPSFVVPTEGIMPRLSFYHWYSCEMPDDDVYDGGNVQISTDGGSSWTVLSPLNGYDGVAYSYNTHVGGDSVFTGSSNGWRYEVFDLAGMEGSTVEIRFVFGADPYVRAPGWYIDDIAVIYYAETGFKAGEQKLPHFIELKAFPNPFNASCRIDVTSSNAVKRDIEIFDMNGRLVRRLSLPNGNGSVLWNGLADNGAELPNGIYLARAASSEGKTTKLVLMK